MKKSHIILSILSITLLAALPMEAMQPRAIETRASSQYKKFIEAFKCLKKKGWKQCSPGQKRRIVATGLAIIGIVGTTITVITWKRHVGKLLKNGFQAGDWMTPSEKAENVRLKKEAEVRRKELEETQVAAEVRRKEREKKYRKEDAEREKKETRNKREAEARRKEFEKKQGAEVRRKEREEATSERMAAIQREETNTLFHKQGNELHEFTQEHLSRIMKSNTLEESQAIKEDIDKKQQDLIEKQSTELQDLREKHAQAIARRQMRTANPELK